MYEKAMYLKCSEFEMLYNYPFHDVVMYLK